MEPSIVKFLGEDKDEMGADMDTFMAILNRDVEGNKSISQLSNSDHGHLSQGNNYRSNNSVSHDSHWLNFNQYKITNCQIQQDLCKYRSQEPHGSTMAGNIIQNPHITSHRVQNQVTMPQLPTQKLENISNTANQVYMEKLIPLIESQLDKDRIMELQRLYIKFQREEISKEVFVLLLREMVGNQMITMTINKMLTQEARISEAGSSTVRNKMNGRGSEIREPELDSYRKNVNEVNTEREREHFDFSQRGFYGSHGANIHGLLSSSNVNSLLAKSSLKRQSIGKHTRHGTGHQFSSGAHLGTVNQSTNACMEVKRSTLNSSSASTMHPSPVPRSITAELNLQIPLGASSEGHVNDANTPRKKPSIGQKKPLEFLVSSPPQPSKKQKVCDSLSDQSIEQLKDVTAVSGVNLREEEEQLFSGSKENSRVSEASQRVVKEEEERLILQKLPLKNKLAEIMSKYGLKNMNGDVERCLSLGVEERMRVFIHSMIRLSKRRADIEKSRHWTIVTSDIHKQIMEINQKAKEERDMKLFEAERLQKPFEQEDRDVVNGEKEKVDVHAKSLKRKQVRNKEEDEIMRASAANIAARAAVGGDDIFSKWQVMAEQARQKHESGNNVAVSSRSHLGGNVSLESASSYAKASRDNQETVRGGKQNADAVYGEGLSGKFMRSQKMPHTKVARTISVKEAISVLEMEPQMSKSKLLYCLYEKI